MTKKKEQNEETKLPEQNTQENQEQEHSKENGLEQNPTETAEPKGQTEQAEKSENPETKETAAPQNPQQAKAPKESEPPQKALHSFASLCLKYRLATWQSAAVLRLLAKEDDAYVSESEFLSALEKLHTRKMGV